MQKVIGSVCVEVQRKLIKLLKFEEHGCCDDCMNATQL